MKKIFGFIMLAFAVGVLTACNGNNNNRSTIPTYQGMTISHENVISNLKKNKEGDNGNHYGHDKHGHNGSDGDDVDEDIEDIVSIDVETDDEVKYYVRPSETFIIEVHLSNPNQFEIQSFTLNGQKYANYMFKEGSTMELLLLEATAPASSGYTDYTIDGIKYIDGTEIKDVDMSKGDKSIKAGISYTRVPAAALSSIDLGTTSVELSLYVNDEERLIGDNELSIYLSDGKDVVAQKDMVLGKNTVVFENLYMSSTYQFGVVAVYDSIDGKDIHPEWLLTDTFTTLGAYKLNDVVPDKTSISFEVEKVGEKGTISSITLYDTVTDKKVAESDGSVTTFNNLLSNRVYNLYLDYSYELEGETFNEWDGKEGIKTIAKAEPTLDVKRSGKKLNGSTGLEYELRDNLDEYQLSGFGTCMDSTVILGGYYNDKPITRLGAQSLIGCSWITDAVILDTVDEVDYEVFYGTSIERVIFQSEVPPVFGYNILGYHSPSVYVPDDAFDTYSSISDSIWIDDVVKKNNLHRFSELGENSDEFFFGKYDFDVTTTSLGASFTLTDKDNVVSNVKVELFQGESVIKTIENVSNLNNVLFEGLTPMTNYSLKITCTYDLNDGEGEQLLVKNYDFPTNRYYATFIDQEDNVIYEGYQKGENPEFVGDLPTKESTQSSDFEFWKWEVASTEGNNITYFPIFSECTKGLVIDKNSVTKYEGTERNVVIPEHWNGYDITHIGDYAFQDTNIKTVHLPETLTSSGYRAFENCTSLSSITLPDSFLNLGYQLFNGLDSISINVSYDAWRKMTMKKGLSGKVHLFDQNGDEIFNVVIEEGDIIEDGAFACCESLQSITMPEGIVTIGTRAFYHCKLLTEIMIPSTVEIIGEEAFGGCNGLTSIVIPDSVDLYGRAAFADCIHLTSVRLSPNANILPDQLFVECDALAFVEIPEGVTTIQSRCFDNCGALTSVTMPSTIEQIGKQAFFYTWSIDKVYCRCSQEVWEGIMNNYSHDYDGLWSATPYYYSEEEPSGEGNYWHYVDNVPTIWE